MGLRSRRSEEFLPVYKGTRRLRGRDTAKHIIPVDTTENGDVHVRKVRKVTVNHEEAEPLYAQIKSKPAGSSKPAATVKPATPEAPAPKPPKRPKRAKRQLPSFKRPSNRVLRRAGAVVAVIVVGLVGWSIFKHFHHPAPLSDAAVAAQATKLTGINGANPAVIDIVDSSRVAQPFLTGTQNGDKVVLFYQAQKAVIYRPATKKVVRTGGFTPPPPQVFLRQGAPTADMEATTDELAATKLYNLTSRDTSAKSDYKTTLVIDLSQRYSDRLKAIAQTVHGQVAELPVSEQRPEGDILIIVGDY